MLVRLCFLITLIKCLKGHKVMSPHHSDQMSQWSQVSRIALYMAKVKVTDLSVSDKVTY